MAAVATHPDPVPSAVPGDLLPPEGRTWLERLMSVVVGVVAGALLYAALATGLAPGWVALLLLGGLLVAVPSAHELSRRVALNGACLLGWSPVLWWVDLGRTIDRGAFVLAVGTGTLVTMVVGSVDRRGRILSMRPVARAVDALPVLGGLAALALSWTWAFPGTPKNALRALLPGIDNVAHFHMFATIRGYGATTRALPRGPDGTRWAFDGYPQGFHALAATVSEMVQPRFDVGPSALMAYTRAFSVVIVLGTVVLSAAAVSLPGLRRRPLIALPVVTVTWAAFLWEPGQNLLADGFGNFWVACAAVGIALLLSLGSTSPFDRAELVAVSGLMVLVAHSWAPLLALGAPAVLVLLMPLRSSLGDPRLRKRVTLAVGVFGAGALGVSKALLVLLAEVPVHFVVTVEGGIHGTSPWPVLALLVVGCYACVAAPRLLSRSAEEAFVAAARRARLLVLVPVVGVAMVVTLMVLQMRASAVGSYYLLKLFMGYELVLAVLVPAVVGLLVGSRSRNRERPLLPALVAVVATGLATQAFGLFPHGSVPLEDTERGGTAVVRAPYSGERMASGVLAAARSTSSGASFGRDYVGLGPDAAAQLFYTDAWYHAIQGSLSSRVSARFDDLRAKVDDVDGAAPRVQRMLEGDSGLRVIVAPRFLAPMRRALGSTDLAARVVTWDGKDPS